MMFGSSDPTIVAWTAGVLIALFVLFLAGKCLVKKFVYAMHESLTGNVMEE